MNWPPLALGILVVAALFFLGWRTNRKTRSRLVGDEPEGTPYRIYTQEFDQEIPAVDIPSALPRISPDGENGWLQPDGWSSSISESQKVYEAMKPDREKLESVLDLLGKPQSGMAVSILVDQSGSMKGLAMSSTAAAVRHLCEALQSRNVTHEILGFSTAGWQGGFARCKWSSEGSPERPGRLSSLLHVIYKQSEEECLEEESWRVMLHPDILRENVDGEALAWAAGRLLNRAEPSKFLIILSDGAPVDDSTLSENGPSYLERHVRRVIEDIESHERVELGAIGIGYTVDRYYRTSTSAADPSQLLNSIRCLFEKFPSPSRT